MVASWLYSKLLAEKSQYISIVRTGLLLFWGLGVLFVCNRLTAQQAAVSNQPALAMPGGIFFTENKGQWPEGIDYRADLPGGGKLYVEGNKLHFFWLDPKDVVAVHEARHTQTNQAVKGHYYIMELQGGAVAPAALPSSPLSHSINYINGSDPQKWAVGAQAFQTVTYTGVYPGVDMKLYADGIKLKYDFIIHARADAKQIRIKYAGLGRVKLKDNILRLNTAAGRVQESIPAAYSVMESGLPKAVNCTYKLYGDQTVGFDLPPDYDISKPLVIDPQLIFSTYTGSFADNWGFTATYDANGNAYGGGLVSEIVIPTESRVNPDPTGQNRRFPVTPGAFQATWAGGIEVKDALGNFLDRGNGPFYASDVALVKYNNAGQIVWATYLGGSGNEQPHSLIVNNALELYVLGTTRSANFPTTTSAFSTTYSGGVDLFVTRLSADGSRLLGSTYMGGSGDDGVNSRENPFLNTPPVNPLYRFYSDDARGEIVLDDVGNALIASCTRSTNFPVVSALQPTLGGGVQNGCVFKLRADMGQLLWSTYLGGSARDAAYSLKLLRNGQIAVAGGTSSTNFPGTTGSGTWQQTYQGGTVDGFVSLLSGDGQSLIRSTYVGTGAFDQVNIVQTDNSSNIYVAGQCAGAFPIVNATYSNSGGGIFITKFPPTLTSPIYSTRIGTASTTDNPELSITAFLVDFCQHLYISGWGGNLGSGSIAGLPVTADAIKPTTNGSNFYLAVLYNDLSNIFYGSYFGAVSPPSGEHVDGGTSRFDPNGVVYQAVCAGCAGSSAFPTTVGVQSRLNNSPNCNLAVFKFDMQLTLATFAGVTQPQIVNCANIPITFNNTSRNGQTYQWDFGDGSPLLNTISNAAQVHTYTTPGTYTLRMVAFNNLACNLRDTARVTVQIESTPLPAFNLSGGGLQQCGTRTVTFNNATTGAGLGYQWNFGDGSTSTAAVPTHTYANFQPYTPILTALSPSRACTQILQQQVRLGNAVHAAFTLTYDTCNRRVIVNRTSTGPALFRFNYSSGRVSTNAIDTAAVTPGPLTVILNSNPDSICAVSASQSVTVVPTPSANYTFVNTACNRTVSLNNTSVNATNYLWNLGDGSTSTLANPTRVYAVPGIYRIHLTASGSRCPDTLGRDVPAYQLASANFTAPLPACGSGIPFNNTTANGTTYLWRFGNGVTSTQRNPTYRYPAPGFYNARLVANFTNVTCGDSITRRVFQPPVPSSAFTADTNRCDRTVAFTATDPDATLFNWNFGDGSPFATGRSVTHSYGSNGTYPVILQVRDLRFTTSSDSVCVTSRTVPIFASLQSVAQVVIPSAICQRSVDFANNSTNAGSYLWRFGDGSTSTLPTPSHTYGSQGTYNIKLITNPGRACADSVTRTLTVIDRAPVQFSDEEDKCTGDLRFSLDPQFVQSVSWDFGDGTTSTEFNPIKYYNTSGTYTVRLTLNDSSGCVRVATRAITYTNDSLRVLRMPNVFTPNGDGVNDVLQLTGRGVFCVNRITVFDRNGRIVFTATTPTAAWDGTTNEGPAPVGVYFYTLEGRDFRRSGNLTLMR